MTNRDDLIRKLCEEIDRCKAGKLDSLHEHDLEKLSLAALNERLNAYDKRIAEAHTELQALGADCNPAAAPTASDAAPPAAVDGPWDVFISYQRGSEAAARALHQRLTAEGLRVWQDVHNIRHTERWPLAIDAALRSTDRLLLLLTPKAMDSQEVFNEWFYFYNKKKPLHCLLLETSDIHYQLLPYQYIDWRDPAQRDWPRLFRELRADFNAPGPISPSPIVSAPAADTDTPVDAPSPFGELLMAARNPEGAIALTEAQIKALALHQPADLAEYYLSRVAAWSQPRYQLDTRFVNLTLLLDKGEDAQQRWQHAENTRFNDLRDVLSAVDDPALVLLGAPGSGKSTLLRRLQMDHSLAQLRADGDHITFFAALNGYRAGTTPRDWLAQLWAERCPDLPPLDTYLADGRALLLLDAINEMPHKSTAEYHELVGAWRDFTQQAVRSGSRVLFSCRSLDYSASLSSRELRVPQVEVQPMTPDQVRTFIQVYSPTQADSTWRALDGTPQFDLFRTPIYLKLLLDQVARYERVPQGKAGLFTQFVRDQLQRNITHPLLLPNGLLSERDHAKLTRDAWKSPFELPERGLLLPSLSTLAFTMQQKGLETEGALVRIDYDDACDLLSSDRDADILKAGIALTLLDEDIAREEITFFHQLLQEFFAARRLAQDPNPALVHVPWRADEAKPALDEVLAGLADGDPLPPLPQTGWEETTLTAAPMARDPNAFIRGLMPHNLALAARCAASPEIDVDPALKREIQGALIARTQDTAHADLRARIAAGLALGELGDPRFERRSGPHGPYLLPPMITIPAGTYPMGDNDSQYNNEKPAHTITLNTFGIGQFPVTNAEYALFMEAGGYEDETWWQTDEAKAWLRGEGSSEGQKESWRDTWRQLQSITDEQLRALVPERITSEQADTFITVKNWSKAQLNEWLDETFPSGVTYRQPEFWEDTRFNNPAQPVVGVTWFEARAYCAWLSTQTGQAYALPTEAQFEAAARGTAGRQYPYGDDFDAARGNTFESHIRRTTPVGVFDNATPEGALDLSGNAYTWTLTIYDPEQFSYPYAQSDDRNNVITQGARRVLRGGSWNSIQDRARAASRNDLSPYDRDYDYGFRVVRPPE